MIWRRGVTRKYLLEGGSISNTVVGNISKRGSQNPWGIWQEKVEKKIGLGELWPLKKLCSAIVIYELVCVFYTPNGV